MTSQGSRDDRWILGSTHRWREGEKHVRPGYSFSLEQGDPRDWYIKVNWRLVDGQALPVGLEVHSSATAHRKGDQWPESDLPKSITRALFKALPVGEVVAQGRAQVLAIWATIHQSAPEEPEGLRVQRGLADASDHGSPADWKYRLVAQVYGEVRRDQARGLAVSGIAQEVHRRLLVDHGAPMGSENPVRVRKWIVEARKRGYLTEVARDDAEGNR